MAVSPPEVQASLSTFRLSLQHCGRLLGNFAFRLSLIQLVPQQLDLDNKAGRRTKSSSLRNTKARDPARAVSFLPARAETAP